MGLDFYRCSMKLEEKYRQPGMTFLNTIQTNGTTLDDEWCKFLKDNNFLVGLSIDGPEELHDSYRIDKNGKPTFKRVMKGLRLLQKHEVEYNILVTVNRLNANHPLVVYKFLRDDIGTEWIQFIPVVERLNEDGSRLSQEGRIVSERSVLPEQFGQFLSTIFDEWIYNDIGKIYIQAFEAAVRNWLEMPSSGMCVFDKTCGFCPVLEHNGDLYSCDHFVEPKHLLGNIEKAHMTKLMTSEKQIRFGNSKQDLLPKYCLECDVLFACHGGCPKNRFKNTPPDNKKSEGEPGLNYLCPGLKHFFHHINIPMGIITALLRKGRPATDVVEILDEEEKKWLKKLSRTGRNDPCPCGSGEKYKKCHDSQSLRSDKTKIWWADIN